VTTHHDHLIASHLDHTQAMATRIGRLEAALTIAFQALDHGDTRPAALALARTILNEGATQ
jgi:hypothetical protein